MLVLKNIELFRQWISFLLESRGLLLLLKSLLCYRGKILVREFLFNIIYFIVWLCREQWPEVLVSGSLPMVGVREAYLARRTAMHQFKFVDPLDVCFYSVAKPHDHILLDNNDIFSTQVLISVWHSLYFCWKLRFTECHVLMLVMTFSSLGICRDRRYKILRLTAFWVKVTIVQH